MTGMERLTTSSGEAPAMPAIKMTPAASGDAGDEAEVLDLHAELEGVRRDGFVEGERGGVARARDDAEQVGAEGGAELGDVGGVLQVVDEEADETATLEAGGEDARGDDEAEDAAVARAHAVEELRAELLRVEARDDHHVDEAHEHGGGDRHLHAGEAQRDDEEEHDRQERRKGHQQVRLFRQVGELLLDVFARMHARRAEALLAVVLEEQADDHYEDDGERREDQRRRGDVRDHVHHGNVGELGDVDVVGGARRPVVRERR